MRRRDQFLPSGAFPALIAGALLACSADASQDTPGSTATSADCDPDNGGLTLPAGFCAAVFADNVGRARHLTVAPNGDVFVALDSGSDETGSVLALRDTTDDGVADVQVRFGEAGGTGIALTDGALYFAPDDAVLRYPLGAGELRPSGPPTTIVSGLPDERSHRAKSIVIDPSGALFVNIGSPSNVCQAEDRSPASSGMDPCPELDTRAGIWRFDASRTGQTQADGERFATGLRNTVALSLNPLDGLLYGVMHGRDQLHQSWPELYSAEEGAEKPSEEFVRIQAGDDFGWPYCYHDRAAGQKVLAPEYGGDGEVVGRCAEAEDPVIGFPGHWAPDGLLFYTGEQFPERYRGGAFIAFHGSWNRAPLPQAGFQVAFVRFQGDQPAGEWDTFADGFAGVETVQSPGDAVHRPTGLAQGPDGSLYIADDAGGRIWRVMYVGA